MRSHLQISLISCTKKLPSIVRPRSLDNRMKAKLSLVAVPWFPACDVRSSRVLYIIIEIHGAPLALATEARYFAQEWAPKNLPYCTMFLRLLEEISLNLESILGFFAGGKWGGENIHELGIDRFSGYTWSAIEIHSMTISTHTYAMSSSRYNIALKISLGYQHALAIGLFLSGG